MLDEQVKSVLLAGGHATANAVDAWEQAASSGASSLYEVALCSGTVDERALVSDLSAQLGVPSVSLVSFKGKPELLELVPRWMVEQLRALPIGLKEREEADPLRRDGGSTRRGRPRGDRRPGEPPGRRAPRGPHGPSATR